jgi:peptidoglycan-N-acetylglucosamine deacetylase
MQTDQKIVALTFDDGPKPAMSRPILKILEQAQVKATFFLVGITCLDHPDLVKKIAQAGHEIGNHTFNHIRLDQLSYAKIVAEINNTNELIAHITGKKPLYFRPPGGRFNRFVLDALATTELQPVHWSINTEDYLPEDSKHTPQQLEETVAKIIKRVTNNVDKGSIILMHNGGTLAVNSLPAIIKNLRQKGYKFVTISELLEQNIRPLLAKN